jgi:hypothetical protein
VPERVSELLPKAKVPKKVTATVPCVVEPDTGVSVTVAEAAVREMLPRLRVPLATLAVQLFEAA